jgi:hypothetical protein
MTKVTVAISDKTMRAKVWTFMDRLRVWINLTGVDLSADHAQVRHIGCDLGCRLNEAYTELRDGEC